MHEGFIARIHATCFLGSGDVEIPVRDESEAMQNVSLELLERCCAGSSEELARKYFSVKRYENGTSQRIRVGGAWYGIRIAWYGYQLKTERSCLPSPVQDHFCGEREIGASRPDPTENALRHVALPGYHGAVIIDHWTLDPPATMFPVATTHSTSNSKAVPGWK